MFYIFVFYMAEWTGLVSVLVFAGTAALVVIQGVSKRWKLVPLMEAGLWFLIFLTGLGVLDSIDLVATAATANDLAAGQEAISMGLTRAFAGVGVGSLLLAVLCAGVAAVSMVQSLREGQAS